jgi:Uma2 family endonuclease
MVAQPHLPMTEEEYLAFERASDTKHEYYAGEIFAMVGASRGHNLIGGNVFAGLHGQLRRRPCEVYQGDMRVKVGATGLYTYPDVVAVCGEPRFDDDLFDMLLNPTVIIEVLSPSTEAYDHGKKFQHYRSIPSLREYVMIAQDTCRIEHCLRQSDHAWLLTEITDPAATLHLASIGCTLALADLYEKVPLDG